MADAAELGALVDEHDLDAALAQTEGEHAAGDAAADDDDLRDLWTQTWVLLERVGWQC